MRSCADSRSLPAICAGGRLEDRFGSYGKIGLGLIERGAEIWTLKLLLMSCRVMSRGVGTVLLNHVMRLARTPARGSRRSFCPTTAIV